MPEALDYGIRLTDDEYQRRIVELHRGLPPIPSREQDRDVRRRALDLAIDHRLGRDFPRERRDALWAASERVERTRIRVGLRFLVTALFRLAARRRHADALTEALAAEYSKVLRPAELEQFLGLGRGQRPTLPIDLTPRET